MGAGTLDVITTRLRINPNLSRNWFTNTEISVKIVRVRFPGLVAGVLSLKNFPGFSEHDNEKNPSSSERISWIRRFYIFVLDKFAFVGQNWQFLPFFKDWPLLQFGEENQLDLFPLISAMIFQIRGKNQGLIRARSDIPIMQPKSIFESWELSLLTK